MRQGDNVSAAARANMVRGSSARWLEDRPIPRRLPNRYDEWNDGLLTKEDADCCQLAASRDPHGRPPIGFCGPDCERRRDRDERLER